jgi:5-formyltetrahydrofolate cyclo-ligase
VPDTTSTSESVEVLTSSNSGRSGNHSGERPGTDAELIKQAMRSRIRVERQRRSTDRREADAEALAAVVRELPEIAAAHCVATYAAMPGEPETGPLRRTLRAAEKRVLLPVVRDDGHLDWADDDDHLRPAGSIGGPEPAGPRLGTEAVRLAQVVLIPALAVDTLGNRLGQGAGFFDRTLPLLHPSVPILAVVHDNEILDAAIEPIPAQPHDVPVDAIVTRDRCLRLPRHRW